MRAAARSEVYRETLLDAVPVRNAAVRMECSNGAVVLWIPIRRRWWTGALEWIFPMRDEKGFALDSLGREVWDACDGKHGVEQIIEEFSTRHRVRFHDARVSVLQFLRTLMERNLVAVVTDEGAEPADGERA